MAAFQIYQDSARQYRWRLRASNGRTIADSGEGYSTKWNCQEALKVVKAEASTAPVTDLT